MSIINEDAVFSAEIPAADPGQKISAAFTNQQIKALADRTQWLKENGGGGSANVPQLLEFNPVINEDYTVKNGYNAFVPDTLVINDGASLILLPGSKLITATF